MDILWYILLSGFMLHFPSTLMGLCWYCVGVLWGMDTIRVREIHSRPSEFHQVKFLSFLWGPTDSSSEFHVVFENIWEIYEGWLAKGAQLKSAESRIEDRGTRIDNRGSRIEDWESRIEDRGSRIEDRGSRIENRGSRIEKRETRIEDWGSRIENRGSRIEDRRSRVEDRESKNENRGMRIEDGESRIENREQGLPSRVWNLWISYDIL